MKYKHLRVALIVTVFLFCFSGTAYALDDAFKRVDVVVDDKVTSVNTTKETVSKLLDSLDVEIYKDDILTPSLDTEITDNMKITIRRAFMVTVSVDGSPRHVKTNVGTIKTVKGIVEDSIDSETKLIGAKETDPLSPDITIELVTTHKERDEEQSEIPFEVEYVENAEVEEGTETVLTEGSKGVMITIYESTFEGTELVSRLPVDNKVSVPPQNKVIEKGTKKPIIPEPVAPEPVAPEPVAPEKDELIVPGTDYKYKKVITMRASAYTTDRGDSGPITATGEKARVGLVAVDPKFIPLGTMLYVEGYGYCRAADTGGMIKGNAIDLFFNTYNECVKFGRRNVVVYVLE